MGPPSLENSFPIGYLTITHSYKISKHRASCISVVFNRRLSKLKRMGNCCDDHVSFIWLLNDRFFCLVCELKTRIQSLNSRPEVRVLLRICYLLFYQNSTCIAQGKQWNSKTTLKLSPRSKKELRTPKSTSMLSG